MHAYDALGKLGGEGTHIMLGDWSKLPGFLFPPGVGGGAMFGMTHPTGFEGQKEEPARTLPAVNRTIK